MSESELYRIMFRISNILNAQNTENKGKTPEKSEV